MAREWFQTMNLIQSRQIQNEENVKLNKPSIHPKWRTETQGKIAIGTNLLY